MIGPHLRLPRQMLAGSKADFELHWPVVSEQSPGVERPFGHADPGQQILDQLGLPHSQLVPLPPSIESANRRRITHYV